MSMRRRQTVQQESLWVTHDKVAKSPGHPFYEALNHILTKHDFDRYAVELCEAYYKGGGRRSIAPGIYFRMLFIGYFECIGSEPGIEWRCADSLSLRSFLGLSLEDRVPDHSSLWCIRQRLPVEVQLDLFSFVLSILAKEKLVSGKTLV